MLQEPNTPVRVIPNGIDIEDFDLSHRAKNRVLVLTRMFERKGVQYLLKALDGLSIPLRVDIVGEGPHLGELKKIASGLATEVKVQFHGWVESDSQRFKGLFENANIFVLPSESENFPIVLLEAMAASLAVITTRGTGCEEVVGEAGLLVDPFDWQAIQGALLRLYYDPQLAAELGARARVRLVNNYGWRVVTDQYLQVYQEVIR
jgi:glycosyltransferase involved in cell wall biosynthesis